MPDTIKFIELMVPKSIIDQRRPLNLLWSGENKLVYLYLAGCGGPRVSYALCTVPAKLLFNLNLNLTGRGHKEGRATIPLEILSQEPNSLIDDAKGMGCGNLGSKIFFVGGQKPQKNLYGTEGEKDSDASSSPRYSLYEYSSKVFVREKVRCDFHPVSESDSLLSGKASPLVLPVGKSLYVLAGAPVYAVPDLPFEKYNYDNETSTWKWSELPRPPFLDPNCEYFEDSDYCAHAVIADKIHVSTSSSSFTFDTDAKEWKTCTMFGDARPWTEDIEYPPPFEWMNYPNKRSEQSCRGGAPFGFDGGSVLYDVNILICVDLCEGFVVAHQLDEDWKVKESKHVKDLELPSHAISACLAEISPGFLCLVVSCFDHNQDYKTWISMTSFRVFRDPNEIVYCEDLQMFSLPSLNPSSSDNLMWSCINCFVE
ncbi:unnamed protein product [Camellia sinensis]